MRWLLCQPYRVGVFRVFTRQSVVICQAVVAIVVLFVCFIIGNWLFTVLRTWHIGHRNDVTLTTVEHFIEFGESLLSYGIVVDCGSSGSRVFVYCWPPHTGKPRQLLDIRLLHDSNGNPVIMKIEPGLSSYVDNPSDSSEHIVHLLRYASVHVPKEKHKETPVYIMATAGLRLLDTRDQQAILNTLRVDLALQFDFLFSPTHIEVISGKQEGIYSWIATNHALGMFGHAPDTDDHLTSATVPQGHRHTRKRTVGILDLGGASLQIVFELPHFKTAEDVDKNLLAEFNLGCSNSDVDHHYHLYVNTYLGLGSNEARYRYETRLMVSNKHQSNSNASSVDDPGVLTIADNCLPAGYSEHIVRGNETAVLVGTGNFTSCRYSIVPLLNYTPTCDANNSQCAAQTSRHVPTIDFYNSKFYGFSEFFYTMEDILKIGGKYNSLQFQQAAVNYCATHWSVVEQWQSSTVFPRADNNRYRLQCFKSAWLLAVLHEHLRFPQHYQHLTSLQYIKREEVHWTLGALLYKTRYYPLRDIEKHQTEVQLDNYLWTSTFDLFYVLIFTCVLVIGFLLFVCRHRYHVVSRPAECNVSHA